MMDKPKPIDEAASAMKNSALHWLLQEIGPLGETQLDCDLSGFVAARLNNICLTIDRSPQGVRLAEEFEEMYKRLETLSPGLGEREEKLRNDHDNLFGDYQYLMGLMDGIRMANKG